MKKISLLSWILCTLMTACNSAGMFPTPTSTLTPVPSSTATPTESPTKTPTPTITPTPTESSIPLSQLEAMVPTDAKPVLSSGNEYPLEYAPNGTKFAALWFYATGRFRDREEKNESGELTTITEMELVYRNDDGILQDPVWTELVGDNWGSNNNGTTVIETSSTNFTGSAIVSDEELKNLIQPGDLIKILLVTEQVLGQDVPLDCKPEYGVCNEREYRSYERADAHREFVEKLLAGQKIDSNFIMAPFRIGVPID